MPSWDHWEVCLRSNVVVQVFESPLVLLCCSHLCSWMQYVMEEDLRYPRQKICCSLGGDCTLRPAARCNANGRAEHGSGQYLDRSYEHTCSRAQQVLTELKHVQSNRMPGLRTPTPVHSAFKLSYFSSISG